MTKNALPNGTRVKKKDGEMIGTVIEPIKFVYVCWPDNTFTFEHVTNVKVVEKQNIFEK